MERIYLNIELNLTINERGIKQLNKLENVNIWFFHPVDGYCFVFNHIFILIFWDNNGD